MRTALHLPTCTSPDGPSRVPVGTWLKMPTVEPVEIAAHAGFEFVVVDLEHAPLTLETAYRLVNLAALSGVSPLVRVPDHGAATIQRVLDAGAHGILVPHVDSADEARRVVRAARFPPHGDRGAGGTSRAGQWGLRPTGDYLAFGNDRALVVPQLESPAAIDAAAEIAAVEGVDALFVGAADLALSAGLRPGDPAVVDMIDRALTAAVAADLPLGLAFGADPDAAARAVAAGAGFVVLANDTTMLAVAARDLVTAFRS